MSEVKLRDDQFADLVFLLNNPKALLLHEPGVGKTPTAVVRQYARIKEGKRTIWVMPKSLLKKNQKEICRFTPLTDKDAVIVDGTATKVDAALNSNASIFLMGPDRFRMLNGSIPSGVQAIDVDEFHLCFKGPESTRTQWYLSATKHMSDGIPMTGTLIDGRLDSAWPAIHFVEPRYYPLGYRQFIGHHGILDDFGRPVAWKGHDRIGAILGRHGLRRTFASIYGKQEVVVQVEECPMSKRQRALYDEFAETAAIELEEVMIVGSENPGVAAIRAQQIMAHPERFPDPRGEMFPPLDILNGEANGKLERLDIHIEDHRRTGEPFVVFAQLQPEQGLIYERIQNAGIKVGHFGAHLSGPQRAKMDEDFREGRLQALVASAKVAGVGFNWQFWGPRRFEFNHCIFASLTYLDSDYEQAFKRFIRQNRSGALRVTVLAYEESLDYHKMKIHEIKSRDANKVDPTREVIRFT